MNETAELLRDYVENRSESAFQEIVRRYIDLVYSIALRRVNSDSHRAQDVVQTVFTDLARKANTLPSNVMLGGWLHRHCCFVANTLTRSEQRRHAREKEAMNLFEGQDNSRWEDLTPVLDDAIHELGEADRNAITLRYFERQNLRTVGGLFGISEDAAQKRVSRALDKLRELLTKRGVALSATTLGTLLEARSIEAAPAGCASRVAENAMRQVALPLTPVAAFLALLGSTAGKVALGLVVATAAALVFVKHPHADRTGRTQVATQEKQQNASGAVIAETATPEGNTQRTAPAPLAPAQSTSGLRLTVLSAASGEPIPNASIEFWRRDDQKRAHETISTDPNGVCVVPFARETLQDLEVTTRIPTFADTQLHWKPPQGDTVPESYTLRLTKGIVISGRVLNEQDQPVAEAKVGFNLRDSPAAMNALESHNFSWIETETDTAGHWQIDRIAEDVLRAIYGGARHPDYVPSPMLSVHSDPKAEQELRVGTYTFRLGNAVALHGVVLDNQRNPVSGANVLAGHRGEVSSRESTTALDGTFELRAVKPGDTLISASAPQFAPKTMHIVAASNSPPIEIVLSPGKILRLRLVNQKREPIPDVNVWLDTFARGPNGESTGVQADFSPKTDRDGRVFWDQAPEGELQFSFAAKGYMRRDDVKVVADGNEHEIVLPNALKIHGEVRDAEGHQPVLQFSIVTGWPHHGFGQVVPHWSDLDRFTLQFATNRFAHTFEEPVVMGTESNEFFFKFESPGYASYVSRLVNANEEDVTLDVNLQPAKPTRATVLEPSGEPAPNAEVLFATAMQQINLGPHGFGGLGPPAPRTDSQGQITWQRDDNIVMIYAASRSGFAQLTPAELAASSTIQLRLWGRVQGTYRKRGQPVLATTMVLDSNHSDRMLPWLHLQDRPVTDASGSFAFNSVPPFPLRLSYLVPEPDGRAFSYHLIQELTVPPGETTNIDYSLDGLDVVARCRFPAGTSPNNDRVFGFIHTPVPEPPADVANSAEALRQWRAQPEIVALAQAVKSWGMQRNPDGTLKAELVPAGTYILEINAPSTDAAVAFHARQTIVVPDNAPEQTIDLGEILLQPSAGAQPQ